MPYPDTIPSSQYFVCAHELGHSQLYPRLNTPFMRDKSFLSVNRIDVEANIFAVELLWPDVALCRRRTPRSSYRKTQPNF